MHREQNKTHGNGGSKTEDKIKKVAIPGLIGWFLGCATNGLFTFFSDSPGFQLYPFWFGLSALFWCVALELILRHNKHPFWFMVASVLTVSTFVATTQLVDEKTAKITAAKATPPIPHFEFMLTIRGFPEATFALTNVCLKVPPTAHNFIPAAGLLIPWKDGQSNIVLGIHPRNVSLIDADNPLFAFQIPKSWSCELGAGWNAVLPEDPDPKPLYTNAVQTWAIAKPSVLSGNGLMLPEVSITPDKPGTIMIMSRAKGFPADAVAFVLKRGMVQGFTQPVMFPIIFTNGGVLWMPTSISN